MKHLFTVTVLLLLGLGQVSAQGTWTQKANFPGAPRLVAEGEALNGKGYCGLGSTASGQYLRDWWEYDPTTDSWTQKADFPGSGRRATVGFVIGSFIYVGMGWNGFSTYKDMWRYDPATDTWTAIATYPGSGGRNNIEFSLDGKGYVGGGGIGTWPYYDDFWEYDPGANTWTQKASFPFGIRVGGAGISVNGKGYIGLGNGGGFAPHFNDWWEYDPVANTWTQKADHPSPHTIQPTYFLLNDTIYVGLGNHNVGTWPNEVYKYDQANNTWIASTPFAGVPRFTAVNFAINGKGYVMTGQSDAGVLLNDVWEYAPPGGPTSVVTCADLNLTAVMNAQTNGLDLAASDQSLGQVDSLVWDLGNGTTISGQAGSVLNYTYPSSGNYDLCLYVYGFATDSVCVDSVCLTVLAQDTFDCSTLGLSAAFTYTAQLLEVECVGQSSGGTIDYIEWDMGDGTLLTLPPNVNPTHTYTMAGTYQICMQAVDVVDPFNTCIATDCQIVQVDSQDCSTFPVGTFFGYDDQGLTVFFADSSTGNAIDLLEWVWGDGTTLVTLPGATPVHTYPLAGTYQVCLTATAQINEGLTCDSTYCTLITVEPNVSVSSPLETFTFYPNPGTNQLTISSPLAYPLSLKVVDMRGKVVMERTIDTGITQLRTDNWADGNYALLLTGGGSQMAVRWMKMP